MRSPSSFKKGERGPVYTLFFKFLVSSTIYAAVWYLPEWELVPHFMSRSPCDLGFDFISGPI